LSRASLNSVSSPPHRRDITIWTRILPLNWITQTLGLFLRAVLYVYELVAISFVVQIGLSPCR